MAKSRISWLARAGMAAAVASTVVVTATALPAQAAVAALTLSSAAGPAAGGNTITLSSSTAWLSGVTSPYATFSIVTCPTAYTAALGSAATPTAPTATGGNAPVVTLIKLTNNKASVLVPTLGLISGQTSTKWNICVYTGQTVASTGVTASQLIGQAAYTVATAPVYPANNVSPTSGPSLGGTTITVTATSGLPTTTGSITATLGGTPLTNIVPVSSTSFTANTPAHAPGAVTLSITTAAGTKNIPNAFTYANGITVSPNTAPNTNSAVFVDILGAGLLSYDFAGDAAVWLVDGPGGYDPTDNSGDYTNGPTAQCTGIVVIGDGELICRLTLTTGALDPTDASALSSAVPNGTYTVTIVSDKAVDAPADNAAANPPVEYLQTDVSSGATFTVAPY